MLISRGSGDLYHRYRPRKFSEIVGHTNIVNNLKPLALNDNRPNVFLFTGNSGVGKTTSARILASALNCLNIKKGDPCLECVNCKKVQTGHAVDIIEVNAADTRGIDSVRDICKMMHTRPFELKTKVVILDEAHAITADAQNALLKELEETPRFACYILCSTDPKKIIPTVRNRCHTYTFNPLSDSEIQDVLNDIKEYELWVPSDEVEEAIKASAEGSVRNALTSIQKVLGLSDQEALIALQTESDDVDSNIIKEICFPLNSSGVLWVEVVKGYEKSKHLGISMIGMTIAGFFRNRLLKAKNPLEAEKSAKILELFLDPIPEGKLGENHLVSQLYKAYKLRK